MKGVRIVKLLGKWLEEPLFFGLALAVISVPTGLKASGEPKKGDGWVSKPLNETRDPGTDGASLFEKLESDETGVDHLTPVDNEHPLRRVYHSSSACAGIVIGDLDLDGDLDFFAGSGATENSLYLGEKGQPFKFKNVAKELGLAGENLAWAIGSAMVDIDNDGDLDIYICNYDYPNQLFINQTIVDGKRSEEPLKFVESASDFGLDIIDGCVMPSFADFDRDGDLDVYILTHQLYRAEGRPSEPIAIFEEEGKFVVDKPWRRYYAVEPDRDPDGKFLYAEHGRPDRFFRNDGEKGFVDITKEAGINLESQWGNSATWWDYNHDGWPDLYVGNDFKSPDFLYRNNGDGTFTEISKSLLRHTTWFSMGAVQTDLNNDGLTDFILADMLPTTHYMQKASMGSMGTRLKDLKYVDGARQLMRNALYINTGTDRFLEGSWLAGLAMTEWTWAIRSADYDNDGLADVFFTNGIPRQFNHSDLPEINHESLIGKTHWDHYEGTPERREQNMVFRNKGGFEFEDKSRSWGVDHLGMSYGASHADFDGDGRLELLVANIQDPLSFYRNRGTEGNRVVFDFIGTQSNQAGIGCQVTIETKQGKQVRQLFPSGGFLDGDDSVVHFGLGDLESIDIARIDWPSGQTQILKDLKVNQRYSVTEPDAAAEKVPPVKTRKAEAPQFTESTSLRGFEHKEMPFNDFERQPLLPFQLSQLGPGQAWGDVDGDGDPDFFLGGGAGQAGQFFRNTTKAGTTEIALLPESSIHISEDAKYEDMGALFLDADADGDLDLFVVSGGIECDPGSELLQDRLYLNDGRGDFSRSASAIPASLTSGGTASACDFDHDGDLDIFVGGRSVPGEYPRTPISVFYRNKGDGTFEEVAKEVCPELVRGGLVTGSIWSDVDSDGWQDLLVTQDWGPVKLYLNKQGKLKVQTDEYTGFENRTGWFNGIDGQDIDGDGDIDFVATNYGRNTQYQPMLDSPSLIFYGDFDNTGKAHIVEAMFEEDASGKKVCFPFRGLSCSSHAMPFIYDKMKTYHNFAAATLTEVYDVGKLQQSILLKATSLDSVLMINDGEGRFEVTALPHLAQISPGFGVSLSDIDLDGIVDCFIAQNFFTPQEETGPMDSGLSLLLKGTGNAEEPFTPVWPRESGIEIPGDAKSLASVDVNLDGLEDYVVGMNSKEPKVFINRQVNSKTHPLRVRLSGTKGNPQAIGSRVTITVKGMPLQMDEVRAGSGYLTQTSSDLIFAVPNDLKDQIEVSIVWPDGAKSSTKAGSESRFLNLSRD